MGWGVEPCQRASMASKGFFGLGHGGCGDTDEVAVLHNDDVVHGFGFGEVDGSSGVVVGGRSEDFAVKHAGALDVRGVG